MTTAPTETSRNAWRLDTPGPTAGWSVRPGDPDKLFMVSTDTHANEPGGFLADYIEPGFADRLPRLETRDDGSQWTISEGTRPQLIRPAKPTDTVQTQQSFEKKEHNRHWSSRMEEEDLRRNTTGRSIEGRLEDQAADGVDVELLFPNKGLYVWATPDPVFADAMCRAYNRWSHDWHDGAGTWHDGRTRPFACIATGDPTLAMATAHQAAEMGFVGLCLGNSPVFGEKRWGNLEYNDESFEPFWSLCEELGLPLTFHVSTGRDPRAVGGEGGAIINYVCHSMHTTTEPLVQMIGSGVFERHPALQAGLVESGIGFVPWLLESMDHAYRAHHFWVRPVTPRSPPPTSASTASPPSRKTRWASSRPRPTAWSTTTCGPTTTPTTRAPGRIQPRRSNAKWPDWPPNRSPRSSAAMPSGSSLSDAEPGRGRRRRRVDVPQTGRGPPHRVPVGHHRHPGRPRRRRSRTVRRQRTRLLPRPQRTGPPQRGLGLGDLDFTAQTFGGGGNGAGAAVTIADAAISAGYADCIVVFRALAQGQFGRYGRAGRARAVRGVDAYCTPYGVSTPAQILAMQTTRWMHDHGVTRDALWEVAHASNAHAQHNPAALQHGKPLTREMYDEARMIASPFGLYDCCPEHDGAAAIVITTAERARDLAPTPASILAGAHGLDHRDGVGAFGEANFPPPTTAGLPSHCGRGPGVGPADVPVAQFYENFTGPVLMAIAEMGFCAPDEIDEFVADGNILAPDGRLPINTSGGNFGEAYIHGLGNVIEAVRQIRGDSTCQVDDVDLSLSVSGPGYAPGSAVLFGRLP